jgi:hypothetical protein
MAYLPFEAGPHRLQMGLMALKPEDWIEIDETLAATLLAKRRLLAERRDEVFAALPDTEAAGAEVLALLAEHLPKRFPAQYPRMNTTIAVARPASWSASARRACIRWRRLRASCRKTSA